MTATRAYLLSIAGVNIYQVLADTTQLSTRRGGGLLLREAVRTIAEEPAFGLKIISTGASEGLFQFQAASDDAAVELRDSVARRLNEHEHYRHLTFVVDVEPLGNEGFHLAKEAVLARNRCRQFQQPTLALPEWNQDEQVKQDTPKGPESDEQGADGEETFTLDWLKGLKN